jgi:hypothetical protein
VSWSAFSPRRFFVDDRKSHEHNDNHLRFGDFTVRLRFGRTGQDPPETQLRLTIAREMPVIAVTAASRPALVVGYVAGADVQNLIFL